MKDDSTTIRCEDCGTLIPGQIAGGLCVACLLESVMDPDELEAGKDGNLPDQIPDVPGYHFLERIGTGGQGEVWLAEGGGDLKRQVALKLLRHGHDQEDSVARFETECAALALMEHPNIAQVHDAGVCNDGRPFVAMQYIDGKPFTEFARANHLSVKERLGLFEQTCRAVQHAHQKGIIHRDLKPSNLLVTRQAEGDRVYVIDFGIARAVERPLELGELYTHPGQVLGTPAYMSPEQLGGKDGGVDTRSDVYALGVVLYELLTDALPFDENDLKNGGIAEWVNLIQSHEAVKPSVRSGSPELRKDMDWVVAKCLEKDPERRYQSPGAVADEIGRFLSDEPVETGPPTASHQLSKFFRRHKVGVTAGGLILLTTMGAAIVSVTFGVKASRAESLAEKRAARGEAMVSFLLDELYEELEPSGQVDVLRNAAEEVENYYAGLPEAADSEAVGHRARALLNVSRVDRARSDAIDRALALYRSDPGASRLEIAEALLEKALVHRRAKQADQLLAVCDEALAILRDEENLPEVRQLRAKVLLAKARGYALAPVIADRDYDSAIECQRLAEAEAKEAGRIAIDQLAEARLAIALDLLQLVRKAEAKPYATKAHTLALAQFEARPTDVRAIHRHAQAMEALGVLAFMEGCLPEALDILHQARVHRESLWKMAPTNNDFRYRLGKNLRMAAQIMHAGGDDLHAREAIQLAVLLEKDFVAPGTEALPVLTRANASFYSPEDQLPTGQSHAFVEGSLRHLAGVSGASFGKIWRLTGSESQLTFQLEKPGTLQALTIDHFAGNFLRCHALHATVTFQFLDGSTEVHPFHVRDASVPAVDALLTGDLLTSAGNKISNASIFRHSIGVEKADQQVVSFTVSYRNATPESALYLIRFRARTSGN